MGAGIDGLGGICDCGDELLFDARRSLDVHGLLSRSARLPLSADGGCGDANPWHPSAGRLAHGSQAQ